MTTALGNICHFFTFALLYSLLNFFFLYCEYTTACFTLGLVITTAYDSMTADAVNYIIKQTKAKAIFTEVNKITDVASFPVKLK